VAVVAAIWLARQYPTSSLGTRSSGHLRVPWIAHERLLRTLAASTRLQGSIGAVWRAWMIIGQDMATGVRFLDPTHLYATLTSSAAVAFV
jgi:hypothetical protein